MKDFLEFLSTISSAKIISADIDYAEAEALTTFGIIGIKVWICKGEVYGKRDLSPNFGMSTQGGPSAQKDRRRTKKR